MTKQPHGPPMALGNIAQHGVRGAGTGARAGRPRPKPMGGGQRSHRSRGTAKLVLSLYEAIPDITLRNSGRLWPRKARCFGFG